jgi:nitrate/TMAO reductase-like tetraheme cytochrome c subunit
VRDRRLVGRRKSRAALVLVCVTLCVVVAVVGLAAWFYTEPASAAGTTTTVSPTDASVDDSSDLSADDSVDTLAPEATSDALPPGGIIPPSGSVSPSAALDPDAPREYVDQTGCLKCHGDASLAELMTKQRPDGSSIALYVDPNGLSYSVHRFNDCTACHTSDPHDVQSPLTKLSLAEKCGSCHQYEYDQYIKSVHGAPQTSGNSDPATCVDCHSNNSNPHNVVRVLDPGATTYPQNIAQTCAKCHDDEKLMAKYGIVEKVYDSYMNSFHGKAMSLAGQSAALQQLNKATCVNCHGSHNIALVSDPNSPVAGMANLAKTCEQCHPGAGVEFAKGFLGHKEADPSHVPQVFWGEKFFFVFTRLVLGFGVVLVAAPIGRRLVVDRIKPPKKPADQGHSTDRGEREPELEPEPEPEAAMQQTAQPQSEARGQEAPKPVTEPEQRPDEGKE